MDGLKQMVHPRHTALLVVDMQNDFLHGEGASGRAGNDVSLGQGIVPALQKLIAAARHQATPIIYTQAAHSPWTDTPSWLRRSADRKIDRSHFCYPGTWGWDFYGVSPLPDEAAVQKPRFDAFYCTDLEVRLRAKQIKTLLMTGVATNVCVQTTAVGGYMRDYNIVVVADCCAARSPEDHDIALNWMRRIFATIATSEEIMRAWEGISTPKQAVSGPAQPTTV